MIELENITKHYELNGQRVPILKGISLFVGQGEFVSIMGPSGSGKSTLSAILGCLSTPTGGTYKINGEDVTGLSQSKVARLRNKSIGFIFQDFNLLAGISAMDNVALPLVYSGVGTRERRARALECLRAVGLENRSGHKPNQLSGGQKQRVAIARSLVNHPKFLFADEPTGALDKKTGQEILGIMQRLNSLGHTVIQVTHSPVDANYSKRIVHLVDGNIVRDQAVEKPTIGIVGQGEDSVTEGMLTRMWRVAQFAPTAVKDDLRSLTAMLEKSNARESRLAAARAVVRWPTDESEPIVRSLFESEDWVVRAEIIKYCNLRERSAALPWFVRALGDPNAWVRHSAIVELKDVARDELDENGVSRILQCLDDSDERVRATAVFIVGNWNPSNAAEILRKMLLDPDGRVRANAVDGIRQNNLQRNLEQELLQLSSDKSNRVRANVAVTLAAIRPEECNNIAMAMLRDSDPLMRSSGAWLVGMAPGPGTGPLLLELLRSESEEIAINQIVRSLAKMARRDFPLSDQIVRAFGTDRQAS